MLSREQEHAHYNGIGSSTAAAIVGLDPWCTPYRAWRLITDPSSRPDLSNNLQVKLGNLFEDGVCQLAAEHWKLQLLPPNPNVTLYHKSVPYFLAHPDRFVVNENAAVEAKFRGANMRRHYEDNDGQPLDTEYAQCQWQCLVGGFDAVYLCVVFGNADVKHWRVPADPEDMELLRLAGMDFWQGHILTGVPPDSASADDVRARYPISAAGKSVETTSLVARAVAQAITIRSQIDALQAQDEELRNWIVANFGDAESLAYDGRVIATFKTQKQTDIDVKRLRAEAPDVAQAFSRDSSRRVLRLKTTVL